LSFSDRSRVRADQYLTTVLQLPTDSARPSQKDATVANPSMSAPTRRVGSLRRPGWAQRGTKRVMSDRVVPQKRPAAAPIRTRSPASLDGMRRSRAALTGALIAAVISGALIDLARGGDRVACELQRVTGDGHYWAYRIIDDRECWYPGRPGKPKNELYWGRATTPSARQTVDQPEPETETEPFEPRLVAAPQEKPQIAEAMPAEWRATSADQLLAFTCCWPELEEPARPPAWPLALLP